MLHHLTGILSEILSLWADMGVYLVFGFAVAGVLSRVLARETIGRHLGGSSMASVAKATLLGIPLPRCSCGVIPVILSLRNRGAGRGATTGFLISTPQTGVDSIAVTWAFLGPVFALVRPLAALLSGLLGGGLAAWLERSGQAPKSNAASEMPDDSAHGAGAVSQGAQGHASLVQHVSHAFRYGFLDFPREIANWLPAGILLAGVIAHFLPSDKELLREYLGTGIAPMLAMMVVGVPLYVCATASVPVVAVLVVKGGLSAGGALVFLMTGPATNAASLLLIARVLGRRTAAAYLGSILITSFACGYALDAAYAATGTTLTIQALHHGPHEMLPVWLRSAGALGLGLILAVALRRNAVEFLSARGQLPGSDGQTTLELRIDGMTCANCAGHVRRAAESVEGVEAVWIDLKKGIVRVTGSGAGARRRILENAIGAAGYRVAEDRP